MSAFLVPRSDVSEFRKRYRWMALVAFLAFAVVGVRLFQLQVVKGAEYAQIAHENVIRRVSIPTTRGIVREPAVGLVRARVRALVLCQRTRTRNSTVKLGWFAPAAALIAPLGATRNAVTLGSTPLPLAVGT